MTFADLVEPEQAKRFFRGAPGVVYAGEWRVKRKDGVVVPIEASTRILADGRSVAFMRDITERRRAERDRDESLRWMRAVVEHSPIGLLLAHSPRGAQLEFNARAHQMMLHRPERLDDMRGSSARGTGSRSSSTRCRSPGR